MTRKLRVALTQTVNAYRPMPATIAEIDALRDSMSAIRQANIDHHCELVSTAEDYGVALMCFGELCPAPYFALTRDPMWRELAEDAESGPTVSTFRQVARDCGMILVVPIYEVTPAGRRFNTAVVIADDGEILGKYRKTHIPEGENEQNAFCETFYYQASDGNLGTWPRNISKNPYFPVFATARCRLGVSICYDRHFPGVVKTLAAQGAELIVSPAVTFGQKSRVMWDREFTVDAARHNVFIGGSNRLGSEPPWNQEYFGASHFVGPNGVIPTVADTPEELVIADLDLDELTRPDPSGWNITRDLRPDIYD